MTGVSAWLFSLTDIGRNTLPVAGGMYRYDRGFRSGRPGRCCLPLNCLCSISSLAGLCPLPSPASPRKSSTDWQAVVAAALCEDGTRGEGAVGKSDRPS